MCPLNNSINKFIHYFNFDSAYSVAYSDRVTVFGALYRSTSVKGGAHTRYVDLSGIDAALLRVWAPPLTEILRYSAPNTVTRSKYATE